MKINNIFNKKNILSFIEGYSKYYYNEVIGLPPHILEQVLWRMSICKDDCIPNNKCEYCGCNAEKKLFVIESCNEGEKFPDLMNIKDWEEYKKVNKIKIENE